MRVRTISERAQIEMQRKIVERRANRNCSVFIDKQPRRRCHHREYDTMQP